MDYTARRNGGGVFEGLYKLIMRRNSIYVTFVEFVNYGSPTMLGNVMRTFHFWVKGHPNEFLSSSSHFEVPY
ncbi:hypothetical protein OIU84_015090 [Salix udensis]|uniref:Uncharacterized protein n=1 Tax=Salix udensis TaxID=889485 RepID=A0AAD6JF76_9ROSI|nr:hypothetical protein OIU84_015090 [Salix udensis]